MGKHSKIGSIPITYNIDEDSYSDGKYEDMLTEFFSGSTSERTEEETLTYLDNNQEWPIVYHLSPLRKNLLNWYSFKKDSSLLEVGTGCGALTDVFTESCKSVTALELTKRRAEIIAHRYKSRDNLEIIVDNLENYSGTKKYDYVTCIGVLEYSGEFIAADDPYATFVNLCRSNLKKGGTFILSIENKLGLKYWAGAREDHTWKFFDSIEGYPHDKKRRTFSKNELTELLEQNGFTNIQFYYPIPDMKLPTEVYSEAFTPNKTTMIGPGIIPAPALDAPRVEVFNEWLALNNLVDSKDFDTFANSFIVFAEKK